jgi:hypothetical protein
MPTAASDSFCRARVRPLFQSTLYSDRIRSTSIGWRPFDQASQIFIPNLPANFSCGSDLSQVFRGAPGLATESDGFAGAIEIAALYML